MRLELIDVFRLIIIAFLSYIPTVAISGWFEAWAAKKLGDDIPEQFGFLTFDPFVHFNLVGFAFLLIGKIFGEYITILRDIPGWGKFVPISPRESMSGGKIKVVAEFLARSFAHFMLLLAAFFSIIFIFKGLYLKPIMMMSVQTSSLMESLRLILLFFFEQNVYLFIIYFVIGLFRTILFFYFPNVHMFSSTNVVWAMILLVFGVMIGAHLIEFFLQQLLISLEYLIVGR